MKRAASVILASLSIAACSGEAPDDPDPIRTDTGASSDDAAETSGEDSALADTGTDAPVDTAPDGLKARVHRHRSRTERHAGDRDAVEGDRRLRLERRQARRHRGRRRADVDWFTYLGKDTTCVPASMRLRRRATTCASALVAFCSSGATAFKSCKSGEKTTVAGVDGCCARGGKVELEHECTLLGLADDADVWIARRRSRRHDLQVVTRWTFIIESTVNSRQSTGTTVDCRLWTVDFSLLSRQVNSRQSTGTTVDCRLWTVDL